jgi:hypothetical protein
VPASKLFRNVPMITSLEVSRLLEFQLVATGSAGAEPGVAGSTERKRSRSRGSAPLSIFQTVCWPHEYAVNAR